MRSIGTLNFAHTVISIAAIAVQGLGQSPQSLTREREVPTQYETTGLFNPVWSGKALLSIELNRTDTPIIWSTDKEGKREEIRFSLPESRYIDVRGLAGGRDGSIIVIGGASNNHGQSGGYLAIVAPDRSRTSITRTEPYTAKVVTVAPDGVIWTVGCAWDDNTSRTSTCNILRRFDSTGNLLSTSALKVTPRAGFPSGSDVAPWSGFRASSDRIGWLTTGNEYIEFSFDGTEIARYVGPRGRPDDQTSVTFAMSQQNTVLVGWPLDREPVKSKEGIVSLDRATRSWKRFADLMEGGGRGSRMLLGFDGETLVTSGWRPETNLLIVRHALARHQ